jgi:ATP phosphoribosyltransferase
MTLTRAESIVLALPSKGHLFEGTINLLESAGYRVHRDSERQYEATLAGHPQFEVVLMRPADIAARVDEGCCHLGVTGYDVFAERAAFGSQSHVILPDLGFGRSRMVVGVPGGCSGVTRLGDLRELSARFQAAGRTLRVSTKYPRLTTLHFRRCGIVNYRLIDSAGTLELHQRLGIADAIVDLTSSGATLHDNQLREIEGGTVLVSAACLIGHEPSLGALAQDGEDSALARLLDAIDFALISTGWLRLEVVGSAAGPDPAAAERAVAFLHEQGARQVVREGVWPAADATNWRVTAIVPEGAGPGLNGPLLRLGASSVIGMPVRHLCERDQLSTFDRLVGTVRINSGAPDGERAWSDQGRVPEAVPLNFSQQGDNPP